MNCVERATGDIPLREVKIAPSILSADFARLAEEIGDVERAGADMLHIDVMDGQFVPNITIGPPVVRSIRRATGMYLDVHLMIDRPERYIDAFLDAGSDRITIHVESTDQVRPVLDDLRGRGKGAGLTLRPATPVEAVLPYLDAVDLLLIMTVEPGFGGQGFMEQCLDKVLPALRVRETLGGQGFWIQVDGGIHAHTVARARAAGVEIFVAGSAVFGSADRARAIGELRMRAQGEGDRVSGRTRQV